MVDRDSERNIGMRMLLYHQRPKQKEIQEKLSSLEANLSQRFIISRPSQGNKKESEQKWQCWLLSRPQAKTEKECDVRRQPHRFQVNPQQRCKWDVRFYISFITSNSALFTLFTLIITTCTSLIQRETSESCSRGPHCKKAPSLHLTPRHRHPTHNWTCSPSSRNFTPCTLQNSMFCKKKSNTSIQHYVVNDFPTQVTPFKTITVTYTAKHHKLTPFKTLMFCSQTGLLSRPSCFWTQIDSFQDPMQWTIWNITQLTHFKTHTLVYYSVSISMGDYLQIDNAKSPWETSSIHNSSKHPTQWIPNFIVKQKEKDSSHADNWHIPRSKINTFYTKHHHFHQNQFLSRPQKLHINCWQQYPSKDTIFSTPTQDKDTVTIHFANLYVLISDFNLLKSK